MISGGEENRVIWRFSDGRAGHDSQSRGLVTALTRVCSVDVYELATPIPAFNYCTGLVRKLSFCNELPQPDLLIGAGHSTHLPMLLARYARGGRSVVLMKPSLPMRLFDLCLVPDHDNCRLAKNLIVTCGPLNMVSPSANQSSRQGLILVGGPSRHFHWQDEKLRQQLLPVLGSEGINWVLADSPRTPASTREFLKGLQADRVRYVSCTDNSDNNILDLMQAAGTVWVSEDSMSMIYEALSSGAAVGVLRVPGKAKNRLANVAEQLAARKLLTLFEDWVGRRKLLPPKQALCEADRCAQELLNRFPSLVTSSS